MVSDSVSISVRYRPAWSYAMKAREWLEKIPSTDGAPLHIGEEGAFIALTYSSLCLEALIDECLTDHTSASHADLFEPRVSVARRWHEGITRLAGKSPEAVRAVAVVQAMCKDKQPYGLLIRARNKLVHPRAYEEVIDENGHNIRDGSIEHLVNDLRSANLGLPETCPAFPHIVQCLPAAKWAVGTMQQIVTLTYEAMEKPLEERWQQVFNGI